MTGDRNSSFEELQAAATLIRSNRIKTFIGVAVATIILPVGGWFGAKLDTKLQVDRLSDKVDALSSEVMALTTEQRGLAGKIDHLTSRDPANLGPIFVLQRGMRYAHRTAVAAYGAAMGGETTRMQARKRKGAGILTAAFDNRIRDSSLPYQASEEVIRVVAVP